MMEVIIGADRLGYNGNEYPVKRVVLTAAASGDNTVLAAVVGKKIQIVGGHISFSGTVNAKFTDGAAGTNLSGLLYGAAATQAPMSFNPLGHFITSINTALVVNLSAAIAIGGWLDYIEVD